ncbi:hypothetical protein OPT61_g6104 [Boeremia exigua]|uniref:Uncharacterized protein n=1 Tax=Boeremia exigua TaxID=749465 RepID=A0ACC2I7U5_9PLEO|nr:hypothetical protein OPT61_g6104 [Boeremia exigua]
MLYPSSVPALWIPEVDIIIAVSILTALKERLQFHGEAVRAEDWRWTARVDRLGVDAVGHQTRSMAIRRAHGFLHTVVTVSTQMLKALAGEQKNENVGARGCEIEDSIQLAEQMHYDFDRSGVLLPPSSDVRGLWGRRRKPIAQSVRFWVKNQHWLEQCKVVGKRTSLLPGYNHCDSNLLHPLNTLRLSLLSVLQGSRRLDYLSQKEQCASLWCQLPIPPALLSGASRIRLGSTRWQYRSRRIRLCARADTRQHFGSGKLGVRYQDHNRGTVLYAYYPNQSIPNDLEYSALPYDLSQCVSGLRFMYASILSRQPHNQAIAQDVSKNEPEILSNEEWNLHETYTDNGQSGAEPAPKSQQRIQSKPSCTQELRRELMERTVLQPQADENDEERSFGQLP